MNTILYVGRPETCSFVRDFSLKRNYDFKMRLTNSSVCGLTNDILSEEKDADVIIICIEEYIDEKDVIVKELRELNASTKAKLIIYARGYTKDSLMVRSLVDYDIKALIFPAFDDELIEQLDSILSGKYDAIGRDEINKIEENIKKTELKIQSITTIGVAGTERRIGTTTQAFQILQYLTYMGYKAAYIEANSNKYLKLEDITYTEGTFLNMVDSLDEFAFDTYSIEERPGIDEKYDFLIYDYGSLDDRFVDKNAFIKDDIKFLVGGIDVAEFYYLYKFLVNPAYCDCSVILNFVGDKDKNDFLNFIDNLKSSVNTNRKYVFAPFIPDMFDFANLDFYKELIPLENRNTEENEKNIKKKRKLFGKKRKGNE